MKKLAALALTLVLCVMLALTPALADSLSHFSFETPGNWTYMMSQDFEMTGFGTYPADIYLAGSDVVMIIEIDLVSAMVNGGYGTEDTMSVFRDNSMADIFFALLTTDSSYTDRSEVMYSNGIPYITVNTAGYPSVYLLDNGYVLYIISMGSSAAINAAIPCFSVR